MAIMKLPIVALLATSILSARASVTTEVYYRLGEDGVRAQLLPVDSSGHRRDGQAWIPDPAQTIVATDSPPTGVQSGSYYHFNGAAGYYAFAGSAYTPPKD